MIYPENLALASCSMPVENKPRMVRYFDCNTGTWRSEKHPYDHEEFMLRADCQLLRSLCSDYLLMINKPVQHGEFRNSNANEAKDLLFLCYRGLGQFTENIEHFDHLQPFSRQLLHIATGYLVMVLETLSYDYATGQIPGQLKLYTKFLQIVQQAEKRYHIEVYQDVKKETERYG